MNDKLSFTEFERCVERGKAIDGEQLFNLVYALHEENQRLKRHIKANTLKKIKVEDVFNCAKYDKFYNNKEAIKSIDWIAEQLGVDLE